MKTSETKKPRDSGKADRLIEAGQLWRRSELNFNVNSVYVQLANK